MCPSCETAARWDATNPAPAVRAKNSNNATAGYRELPVMVQKGGCRMAVGLAELPILHFVQGVRLGTVCAGIKKPGRRDLVLIELSKGSHCAAVFSCFAFCAAPVRVAQVHLAAAQTRKLLINTGNANAGTGEQGKRDALTCCEGAAALAGVRILEVLPFSTGVSGEPLPVQVIAAGLPAAQRALSAEGWVDAAHGIMTPDTVAKGASRRVGINGHTVTVSGDTSIIDACVLMATGRSGLPLLSSDQDTAYPAFARAVTEVCEALAQAIVRDGEGATKLITVDVRGGADAEECRQVAFTIAHSPLVKTAFFASDPNWGRILAAVGRAGLYQLVVERVDIYLDDVCIVRDGGRAPDYAEMRGREVMAREEITVRVELGRGPAAARVWTCDFSYDYVRINAEYRT